METVTIELEPDQDEAPVASGTVQAEVQQLYESFDNAGMPYSPQFISMHALSALDYTTGTFSIARDVAVAFAPFLTTALVAWIKLRASRRVRVTVGNVKLEATKVEEIEKLIPRVLELQAAQAKKKVGL